MSPLIQRVNILVPAPKHNPKEQKSKCNYILTYPLSIYIFIHVYLTVLTDIYIYIYISIHKVKVSLVVVFRLCCEHCTVWAVGLPRDVRNQRVMYVIEENKSFTVPSA